jgi:putative ABC transport system permease protein
MTQATRGRRRSALPGLLAAAAAAIVRRPGLAVLTGVGTALGVGSVVATLGIATTAAARVGGRIDELRPTEVIVRDREPGRPDAPFPADAAARLARLPGVRAAGVLWTTRAGEGGVLLAPDGSLGATPAAPPVVAATAGALRAAGAVVGSGRLYDGFLEERGEPVALLGADAARALGVTDPARRQALFVGDLPLTVIGTVDRLDGNPELLRSVIVPPATAARLWGLDGVRQEILIRAAPGAAQLVGRQAPLVLRPDAPGRLAATVPPEPERLAREVDADLTTLLTLLAALSLAIGTVGVVSAMLLAARERRREIALRVALGIPRRQVAGQLMAEGAALGTLAGVLGALGGAFLVVAFATAHRWTAVVEPSTILLTPLLGTAAGLLAGLYPAFGATARPSPPPNVADVPAATPGEHG